MFFRPDSTMNRDGDVYYIPEGISSLKVSHFVYVRIERAGKCIAPKFAHRYFSSYGEGLLISGNPDRIAGDSSNAGHDAGQYGYICDMLDNSTILAVPGTVESLAERTGESAESLSTSLAFAVVRISSYASLKTGDIVGLVSGKEFDVAAGDSVSVAGRTIVMK